MQEEIYQTAFRPHSAIYLTTVGYGLGAIDGQGGRRVKDVFWKDELGLPGLGLPQQHDDQSVFLCISGCNIMHQEMAHLASFDGSEHVGIFVTIGLCWIDSRMPA
ncbi:MAG: hypothetical protein HYZ81_20010 [Nitrospinae bacterium]|nr:hypothetical protein [Nitrospinota bacterium]